MRIENGRTAHGRHWGLMQEQAQTFSIALDRSPGGMKSRIQAELERHPFAPAWWARSRHPQTCWSPLFRTMPEVDFRLERWTTPDDDFLRIHHADPIVSDPITNGDATVDGAVYVGDPPEDPPVLLILHGLEGSVQSNYVLGLAAGFTRAGWRVVAMEHRSCGGEINRARRLYHSGVTDDLAFVVDEIVRRGIGKRIYIAGISLGGNQTVKWLGEEGESIPECVQGAAAVCVPFDLTISGPIIDQAAGGAYVRRFFKTLIPKAIIKEQQFPGCIDIEKIKAAQTFEEFDTYGTAALHGFDDARHYWKSVGCGQFLGGVRRPLLLISAEDDPFNPGETLPREACSNSPWLIDCFSKTGGHVGFIYGRTPRTSRHWAEEQILRALTMLEAELTGGPEA